MLWRLGLGALVKLALILTAYLVAILFSRLLLLMEAVSALLKLVVAQRLAGVPAVLVVVLGL